MVDSASPYVTVTVPVYNIEVHGHHVYEVTDVGILVHNAGPACVFRALNDVDREAISAGRRIMPKAEGGKIIDHIQGRPTKYLSVSLAKDGTARFNSGRGVIAIDLDVARRTGSGIVPHEQLIQVAKRQGTKRDLENVQSAVEILLTNGLDPKAIIRELSEDIDGLF